MEGANIHSVIKNPPDVVSLAALHEDAETLKLVPGQMQEINGCLSSNEFLLEPPLQTCFAPQPPAAAAVIAEPAEATDDESDQMDNQADDVCLLEFETKESTADCVALKKVVSNHDAEQSLASSTPIVFRVSEQFKPKMRLDFNKSETLEPAPMEIEKCRATNVEPSTSKVQNQKKLKFTEPPFHILRTNPAVLPVTSKQLVSSPIKPSDNKFEFEINDDESFCFESWFRKDKVVNKEPDKERKKSVVNEKELAKKGKTRKKGAVQEKVAVQPGLHPTGKHSGSKKRKASEDNNPGATQKVPASRQLNYNKRNEQQEKEEEGNEPLPRSKRLLTPIRTTKMGERKRAEQGKTSAMAMTKVVEELEEEPSCSVEEKANKAKISQKTPQRLPASGNVAKARCGKQPGTVSGDYGPSNRAQSKSIPLAESEASEGGNDDENDQVVELENRKKYVISGKSSSTPSRNPITIKSKRPAVTPPPSKHTVFRTSTPMLNESEREMWEDPKSSCSELHVRKGKVISRKPVKQGKNSSVPKKRGRPRKHPQKTPVAMPEVEDQEEDQENLQEEPPVYVENGSQAKNSKASLKRPSASRGSINCPTERYKKRSGRPGSPDPSAETRTQNTKPSGDYGPSNRAQSKSIPLAESEASEGGNDDENDQVVELENRKKYVISGKSSSALSRHPVTIKSKRPAVTPPPSKHTVFRTSTPISNESECEMWEDPKSSCSESHVRKGKVISRKPVKQGKNSSVPKKRGRPRKHPEKTAVAMPEVQDQEKLQEEPRVYVKKANQAKKLKETIENSKRQLASRGSVNCPTDRSKKRSGRAPSAETRTQNTKTSAKMKQTDTKKTERTQSGYLTKQINPSVFHEDDFHSISDLHPDSDETYTISGRHIRPPNQWWKVAQQDYSPPVSSRREAKSSRHSSWLPPSQNKIKHRAGKSSAQKTKIYNLSKRDSSSAQIKSVVPQPLSSDEDADFAGDELDYDDDSISVFYDIQSQPAVQYENDTISGALTAQSGKHLFKSSVPRKRAFPELAKDQENPSALYPATKRPKRCPQSLDKLNENRIKQLKRFSAFEKPIAISRQARNLLLSSASKTMSNEIFETYPAASSNPNPRYTSIPAHDAVYDSTSKRWFLKTTESGQKDSASQTEPWQNLRETIEDSGESGLNPGSRDEEVKQQRMNLFLLNASGPGPANQASYPNSDHHILLSDCVGISGTNDFEYPLKLDYNENDTSLGICKDLDLDTFACGKLFLGPFREKGIQRECGDTMLFYIIQGHIKVSINNNLYNLSQGDCFCVPPGNPYNITNSLNFPAILFFTQLKHPDVNQ
ncbi:serine/arginine repetitive matrix protein 1 isoform X2 [Callorhinchus milii]|uniref:serine/arginine repetitive matrix protein 1 isoform X2 n=1 Tax=Callorhinchus milii TaxID=7868 RepID=UPI001C3FB0F1|nr:serine/arginine repetitive matrix protein 1 isoform X2 [Callorhinchus milii]